MTGGNIIRFRAFDGKRWWYEGDMNGCRNYLTVMETSRDGAWMFKRCRVNLASSEKESPLEYKVGSCGEWKPANLKAYK